MNTTKAEVVDVPVVVAEPIRKFYKRPRRLQSETIKTATPLGKAYVTISRNDKAEIEEIFIKLGKAGADIAAISDGLAIALTGMLSPRFTHLTQAEKLDWLIKKYTGMSGANSVGWGGNRVDSLPDAIAKVIIEVTEGAPENIVEECDTVPTHAPMNGRGSVDLCPNCGGSSFVRQDGCWNCLPELGGCGHSKCG